MCSLLRYHNVVQGSMTFVPNMSTSEPRDVVLAKETHSSRLERFTFTLTARAHSHMVNTFLRNQTIQQYNNFLNILLLLQPTGNHYRKAQIYQLFNNSLDSLYCYLHYRQVVTFQSIQLLFSIFLFDVGSGGSAWQVGNRRREYTPGITKFYTEGHRVNVALHHLNCIVRFIASSLVGSEALAGIIYYVTIITGCMQEPVCVYYRYLRYIKSIRNSRQIMDETQN